MKNVLIMSSVAVLSFGLMVTAACSDDDTSTTTTTAAGGSGATGGGEAGMGGSGAQGGGGMGPIEVPTIGDQIDRMGRPAINTATTQTFTADATRAAAEAAYNGNDDPSTWATMYAADVRDSLAILDSLDGDCGNQAFVDDPLGLGAGFENYNTLAAVLANDWLILDSANTDCGYLGVELELLDVDAGACGGRMLSDDVMDATYGAVAAGDPAAFGDTIPAPPAAMGTTFPYLADPN
jgi:hypothetical protein